MTISREKLLREEEEERKRLRYPIGLEIIQEASPPGYITCPQTTNIPELYITQTPTEIISDNDASNLIPLKDLKPLVSSNLENGQEKSAQEQTKVKQEVLRKDETSIEKENRVCHTPIDIDSGDESPDHGATPPLVQLDSHEEADKSQSESTNTTQILKENNPINFQIKEPYRRTDIENQTKKRTPSKSLFRTK